MTNYVITTDSNSDVSADFVKENHLTIIPQYYAFGDTVYALSQSKTWSPMNFMRPCGRENSPNPWPIIRL